MNPVGALVNFATHHCVSRIRPGMDNAESPLPERARLSLVSESFAPAMSSAAPLLPRIAAGDELAVREGVARYGALIWSLVRRWSPDACDAEDAVQEVFVDLWRSAARYEVTRSTEAGWVAMVTRRRLIDRLRHRQRGVELEPLPDGFDVADDTQSDDARDDRVDRARAALRSLPEAQRTALELSLLHGRTHDEIAKAVNTPLGTVKSHIRRGLQRARALLQQSDARHRASDVAREQQGS